MNTHAKRNVAVLSIAQAVNASAGPVAIAVGALSGAYLAPDNLALATIPVAIRAVGIALFAMPVASLCKQFGRRLGFILGTFVGIIGALLSCYALLQMQFTLFCVGFFLIGGAGAFVQQYRFAAADQGDDKFKSRAISWVMTGGVMAGFLGPQAAILTQNILTVPYAGNFLAVAALLAVGAVVLSFLKPLSPHQVSAEQHSTPTRPFSQIIRQPVFIVALLCAVSAYALMTFVMTGAPLAMAHHGHSSTNAILGIQWHVLAMYGPSFMTGGLIIRFGKSVVIAAGLILLMLCALVALSGLGLWNFWVSLILLGLGWNLAFIGATALLGESYSPEEKSTVQGAHDTILFGTVAIAALSSGVILEKFGWNILVFALLPIASVSLLALLWLAIHRRKPAQKQTP